MERPPNVMLPGIENFDRDKYYKPGTNRTTKEAKDIFRSCWEYISSNQNFINMDFNARLEFSREYINHMQELKITNEDFLKSMRRSFSARIGRQRRLYNLENNGKMELQTV